MLIHFRSKKHIKLLQNEKQLIIKYGERQALEIQAVFAELSAANCLGDIPPSFRPHPLEPKSEGKFALDLKHPYRTVVQAYGNFVLEDRSTIKEVVIIEIAVDYH